MSSLLLTLVDGQGQSVYGKVRGTVHTDGKQNYSVYDAMTGGCGKAGKIPIVKTPLDDLCKMV
jgi:hypothetical protein